MWERVINIMRIWLFLLHSSLYLYNFTFNLSIINIISHSALFFTIWNIWLIKQRTLFFYFYCILDRYWLNLLIMIRLSACLGSYVTKILSFSISCLIFFANIVSMLLFFIFFFDCLVLHISNFIREIIN